MSKPYESLAGKQFGKLTVTTKSELRKSSNRQKRFWNCSCKCGKENLWIQSYQLTSGRSTSCGCIKTWQAKFKNIPEGTRIGKLTVTNKWESRKVTNRNRVYWKCICDCGNETWVLSSSLHSNRTLSCGCLCEQQPEVAEINARYRSYKQGAKSRHLDWQLSIHDFTILIKQNCYWCDSEPIFKRYRQTKGKWGANINGIDRVDSSKGYLLENCKPCCSQCNFMKNDYTSEEFLNKIHAIYVNHYGLGL